MGFHKDSAWGQQREVEEERRRMRMGAFPAVPADDANRRVGGNTVEIPTSVLEDWLIVVERQFEYPDGADLEDLRDQMRSYFRG